ncbi:hypothetical protein EVAR_100359_1 [Eumeta japonica]|uniref:CCHC-type domain-containing protein n=1 Tax=Eumeta variegata TaxID=151549 RepID=A0A4C2A8L2_EUMVA|nr:hypothetical protein EVAR_100359_1 [Eumeta japonica]
MCRRSPNESDLDSFSDNSNEFNDEGFTQVQRLKARKPWLHATYGPGFIRLSGKKPKASSSASTVALLPTASALTTSAITSSVKEAYYRLPGAPSKVKLPRRSRPTVAKIATEEADVIATSTSKTLIDRHPYSFTIIADARGLKVQPAAIPDFRYLSAPLATFKVAYHTYSFKEEREFCLVLRGVPKKHPIEEVEEDLLIQNLPMQSVRRITNRARQCFNCHLYGHSSKNCYQRARCVKCLGDHDTTACTRNKDTNRAPACVLYDLREGRSSTATIEDNINAVQLMIQTDKRVTYQQIRTGLALAVSQVHNILQRRRKDSVLFLQKYGKKISHSRSQQDNASQHTVRQTTNYLWTLDIKILTRLAYSSDLVPCDFYLFPKIKEKLRGKWFTGAEEAVAAYEKAVEVTPKYE